MNKKYSQAHLKIEANNFTDHADLEIISKSNRSVSETKVKTLLPEIDGKRHTVKSKR